MVTLKMRATGLCHRFFYYLCIFHQNKCILDLNVVGGDLKQDNSLCKWCGDVLRKDQVTEVKYVSRPDSFAATRKWFKGYWEMVNVCDIRVEKNITIICKGL